MSDQNVAALSYSRVQTTTIPTTLETEYRKSTDPANGNKHKIEQYMTLDPDAVAQVNTVTIALGTVGDDYAVVLTVNSNTKTYRYRQVAEDTAESIASNLATLIDTSTEVQAQASGTVITITSAIPGQPFVIANTTSTVPASLAIAETTANSGTPKHRKRWEINLVFSIKSNGYETVSCEGSCFDGSDPGAVIQRFGPIALSDAPRSLAQIQSEQT